MTTLLAAAESVPAPLSSGNEPAWSVDAHLTFVPDWRDPRFLLWGKGAKDQALSAHAETGAAVLLDESLAIREIGGYSLGILEATRELAAVRTDTLTRLPPSVAAWSLAAKLLLELVGRERFVPRIVAVKAAGDDSAAHTEARFGVALALAEDAQRVADLAKSFPVAAHACVAAANGDRHPAVIWRADAALNAYLDMAADALIRAALGQAHSRRAGDGVWSQRFLAALLQPSRAASGRKRGRKSRGANPSPAFAIEGFGERGLIEELHAWAQPVLGGAAGVPRAHFQLELPATHDERVVPYFALRFFMQAHDSAAVVPASEVFAEAASVDSLHCEPGVAGELLLKSLAAAGRIFAPIATSLRQARPESVSLSAEQVAEFLRVAAPALRDTGMSVELPPHLAAGDRQLRLRMRVGDGGASDPSRNTAERTLEFRWEAELGGCEVDGEELRELAERKSPLVFFRDRWVVVEPEHLAYAQKMLRQGGGRITRAAALAAALGGVIEGDRNAPDLGATAVPIGVVAEGELSQLLASLRAEDTDRLQQPQDLRGELRPYQVRGLAWLVTMHRVQLGACLADDMGLGKSIQLLAFLLQLKAAREERQHDDAIVEGPVLLVCPTSVLGNWQREVARFAPTLKVHAHYGPTRLRTAEELGVLGPGCIVLTSYGLLRRDAVLLKEVQWSVAALDEAQNIKNAASRTARAARSLTADFRVALTGTPMENRLTELWSVMEFLNPGLLGSYNSFRRGIALPIERFAREDIAARLKQIVRPFILRRVKSDPAVIDDLPAKQEMTVYCSLTREQASLYQGAVDAAMATIEGSEGIERRGQVLALMTALKQICNHPAQYLREAGPLGNRSGKLERLQEMLEEALATGERVLVFTQYREMGDRLVRALTRCFGNTVQFLHGGTPRVQRDAMIQRFQNEARGPSIFVLSLKAGGTGLNLTAATRVFHFDRWWNPAVEDQATDRAYRIGQRRNVQVHKFLCAGTIEERVAAMLESKRDLAARIVGEGEQWITELSNDELRDLFSLAPAALIEGEESGEDDEPDAPQSPKRKARRGARAS